jgi:hypothetical protein
MAVLVQLIVTPATQQQFNELDAAVGQSMTDAGGPPEGLMSHVVYPEGDGFVVAEVWRTESDGQHYVDDVLRPLVGDLSLTAKDVNVRPVWSFARP